MSSPPSGPPVVTAARPVGASGRGTNDGLGDLVDRYGWRLFVIPVLAALTIVALFRPGGAHPAAEVQAAGVRAAVPSAPVPAGETPVPITVAPAAAPPIQVWSHSEADPCSHNHRATFVLVDIALQRVSMCEGARQVYGSVATTGAVDLDRATPTGTWIVAGKQTNRYLSGSDYNVFVRYWIPFDGDIGFHDASWQKMPFGAARYTSLGSHGCVHLPTSVMKWLYHWIRPGQTEVTVAD